MSPTSRFAASSPAAPALRRAARHLALALPLLAAAGAPAEEPLATRSVAVRVGDRLGRPLKEVSACLLPACTPVPLRPAPDGFVADLAAGAEPRRLRLTSRSFEAAEATVAPEAAAVAATLKALGSVRASFLAPDGARGGALTVSLKETVDPRAGTRGRLLSERPLTLERRPAASTVVLEDVPPGEWVLGWEGAGLSAGRKVVRVGETRVDAGAIALVAGRSVEGAVRDDLGSVVAGATARLRSSSPAGGTDRSTTTASDGSFAVHGLPLDEVLAWRVTSPEHEDARGTVGGETRLEVVVRRAQRVIGRLVDEDGAPVAARAIQVSYVTDERTTDAEGQERRLTRVEGHPEEVVTGDDGRFVFFRRLADSVQVAPSGGGHLPETRTLEPLGEGAERGELDLGDLVLHEGRTLTGRVAKADGGAPVAGASLEASWAGEEAGSAASARDVSQADGTFRIEGIAPGRELTVTARKEGFAPRTASVDPEADSVDLLLSRGGRVKGRACGTAWEVASMAIWYGREGRASNRNQAAVDSAGRFVVENAEPGTLTFSRSWRFRDPARPGFLFEWGGFVRASVEVEEGETAQVSLGCEGIPLSGVVTREGRPVASEVVSFSLGGSEPPTDALTDAAGAFTTRVPAPGLWFLSAGGSTLAPAASCEVPPGGLQGCRAEVAPAAE